MNHCRQTTSFSSLCAQDSNIATGISGESKKTGALRTWFGTWFASLLLVLCSARARGIAAILGSAVFVYLSSVFVRVADAHVVLNAEMFAFTRFLIGIAAFGAYLLCRGTKVEVRGRYDLFMTCLTGVIAVYLFYRAVNEASLAIANVLNMTAPVFIALLSIASARGTRRSWLKLIPSAMALVGVYFIVSPDADGLSEGAVIGLVSGFLAGVSIFYRKAVAAKNDASVAMFATFSLNAVIGFVLFHDSFFIPSLEQFGFLVASGAVGVFGQFLVVCGLKLISVDQAGVLSSSRVVIAAVVGPLFWASEALGATAIIGVVLVFISNIIIAKLEARRC